MFLSKTARCNTGPCVHVDETAEGFVMTSTIEGNDGAVTYTPDEFAVFLADVKAGGFDDMHRKARERTEPVIA